jgi:hypothetical protein
LRTIELSTNSDLFITQQVKIQVIIQLQLGLEGSSGGVVGCSDALTPRPDPDFR